MQIVLILKVVHHSNKYFFWYSRDFLDVSVGFIYEYYRHKANPQKSIDKSGERGCQGTGDHMLGNINLSNTFLRCVSCVICDTVLLEQFSHVYYFVGEVMVTENCVTCCHKVTVTGVSFSPKK